jgi:hypothetical protein
VDLEAEACIVHLDNLDVYLDGFGFTVFSKALWQQLGQLCLSTCLWLVVCILLDAKSVVAESNFIEA